MNLAQADKFAAKILEGLSPFCERIEIAGSIRRRRENVNDIDIVALPGAGQLAAFRARVLAKATPVSDGQQTIIARLENGVQLDVWIAKRPYQDMFFKTVTNFGTLLLCRTGSKEHNIKLCQRAKDLDLHWNPHAGVYAGDKLLACETEEEIFAALKMEFVPPEKRE